MRTKGSAERFRKGSRNINLMKKEIKETITGVLGFVEVNEAIQCFPKHASISRTHIWKKGFKNGTWEVRLFHEEGNWKWIIRFWVKNEETPQTVYYNSSVIVSLKYVKTIHSALDDFLAGMEEVLPKLSERLSPVYNAA